MRGSGYDAFISYSHAADGKLAPSLQRGLRGFAKPWYRLNALRVFRDQTSLSATPALWAGIERALAASRFFILLASSEAAASPWVDTEVRYWREHKSMDSFLIALTEGGIAWDARAGDFDWQAVTALPRSLQKAFVSEPFWVDLRFAHSQAHVSLHQPDFRNAVADLAAPIHGMAKDSLLGEDISQHRRTMRLARGGVAVLITLVIAASVAASLAVEQRDTARRQRDAASSVALASAALGQLGLDPERSLLLAIRALQTAQTPQALRATRAALAASHVRSAFRAGRQVDALAFGGDGGSLAALSGRGVTIWSVRSRRRVAFLPDRIDEEHAGQVVAFSPHGRFLLASDTRRTVVWRLRDLQRVAVLAPDVDGFSADEKYVITTRSENVVLTPIARPQHERVVVTHALAALPPRFRVFVGDGAIYTFRPGTGFTRTARFHVSEGGVACSDVSPNGRRIVVGDESGDVRILRTTDAGQVASAKRQEDPPNVCAFSRDGRLVVTGDSAGLVRVWDGESGAAVAVFRGDRGSLFAATFSPDGRLIATGDSDGAVRLWRTLNIAPRLKVRVPAQWIARFTPDQKFLLTSSIRGQALLLRLPRGSRVAAFGSESNLAGTSPLLAPGGRLFAAALVRHSRVITGIWRTSSGATVATGPGTPAAFSPDGKLLATIDERHHLTFVPDEVWAGPPALPSSPNRRDGSNAPRHLFRNRVQPRRPSIRDQRCGRARALAAARQRHTDQARSQHGHTFRARLQPRRPTSPDERKRVDADLAYLGSEASSDDGGVRQPQPRRQALRDDRRYLERPRKKANRVARGQRSAR